MTVSEISRVNIDATDMRILEILMENARIDCKAIAKKVGVSDRTVARRIKKMEEKGIIKGYKVEIGKELIKSRLIKLTPRLSSHELIETNASEWDNLAITMKDIFGVASAVILFNIGLAIGRCYGEQIKRISVDRHEQSLNLGYIFQAKGWGKLSYDELDFERGYGKITVSKIPFKQKITNHIIRGIICGCLEKICNKKVSVKKIESRDIADNNVRFVFEISK